MPRHTEEPWRLSHVGVFTLELKHTWGAHTHTHTHTQTVHTNTLLCQQEWCKGSLLLISRSPSSAVSHAAILSPPPPSMFICVSSSSSSLSVHLCFLLLLLLLPFCSSVSPPPPPPMYLSLTLPGHSPQHADVLFLHRHSQRDGVLDESHDWCRPRSLWTN